MTFVLSNSVMCLVFSTCSAKVYIYTISTFFLSCVKSTYFNAFVCSQMHICTNFLFFWDIRYHSCMLFHTFLVIQIPDDLCLVIIDWIIWRGENIMCISCFWGIFAILCVMHEHSVVTMNNLDELWYLWQVYLFAEYMLSVCLLLSCYICS